jgi:hypothetical protein
MKKKQLLVCVFASGVLLAGCSSKPTIGDVEPGIEKAWASCNVIKVKNFKKTNGVDRGDSYQMAISYEAEIVKDIALEDYMYPSDNPRLFDSLHPIADVPQGTPDYMQLQAERNRKNDEQQRAAGKRADEFRAHNCPNMHELLMDGNRSAAINEHFAKGTPLLKGETFEISRGYSMLKTENGWIAQ